MGSEFFRIPTTPVLQHSIIPTRLIAQLVEFVIIKPKVMGDLVQEGRSDLFTQLSGVGKVSEKGFGENTDFVW